MAEKNHTSDTSESEMEPAEQAAQPEDDTESTEITLRQAPELQVEEERVSEEANIRLEEEPPAFGVEPGFLDEAPVHSTAKESGRDQAPHRVSRTRAFWTALGVSALASAVTLLLSLGVLANLNGGSLQFVTTSQLNTLTRQVDGLRTQIDSLDQDVKGLRTRLDNLDALSQNVTAMKSAMEQTRDDVDAVNTRIGTLQNEIDDFNDQIEMLQMRIADLTLQNESFTDFLSGLRDLLDNLPRSEEPK